MWGCLVIVVPGLGGRGSCGAGAPAPGGVSVRGLVRGLVSIAVLAEMLRWRCGWGGRLGWVVFDAFTWREEDAWHRLLKWFWCPLCGCFVFFAAESRLERGCVMAELVGWLGVLFSQRGALLLAMPLCEHGPRGWVVVAGCFAGYVAAAFGGLKVEV